MVKTYKPAQIVNAFYELVDECEKPDKTIEEIWKCLECEQGKGWTNLAQHAIKHDGWIDAVEKGVRTVEERDGNELFDLLQDHRNRKKARVICIS